jgi:hypothetical protein
MEGFEITLNATTEQQRSKLSIWAQSRTKVHAFRIEEHTTKFAGVFINPVDLEKFKVTMARNTKNWRIPHAEYSRWIMPISETDYAANYGDVKTTDDAIKDRVENIKQELRAMGMVPPPSSWDLSDIANAAELLERVRSGNPPPSLKC